MAEGLLDRDWTHLGAGDAEANAMNAPRLGRMHAEFTLAGFAAGGPSRRLKPDRPPWQDAPARAGT